MKPRCPILCSRRWYAPPSPPSTNKQLPSENGRYILNNLSSPVLDISNEKGHTRSFETIFSVLIIMHVEVGFLFPLLHNKVAIVRLISTFPHRVEDAVILLDSCLDLKASTVLRTIVGY
ncbi:hypothetical protein RHMOL_Rhmol13G0022700 [Rhododendron molle]|uniref:Uncharacterized protein n=1 Tax=Rhododendron molle TaxID=49168 RepID=A0ACC0L248_RHOML|nr:hypothetical protein RHMOL_Rhmol13G0022700 [Rhododendron molle]